MFRLALLAPFLFMPHWLAQAADRAPSGPVSRVPPEIYKRIEPLLTPLSEALAWRGKMDSEGKDGVILLDEAVTHVTENGERVYVYHRIEEALNESGVDALAEDVHSYRALDQQIYLALARAILPDGKVLPVEEQAAFLESPQSGAGDSVYGDRGQLRIIHSGMKVGTVCEVIVVIVEKGPRIPGHFSASMSWGAFWPEHTERYVILMPDSVAQRAKITSLGAPTPEVKKDQWSAGWQKWTWLRENVAPYRYERGRPPQTQVGPATMLTTLPDWDAFGDWYGSLLEERAALTNDLRDRVREWTRDAKTQRDKLAAIIKHVSGDLRYTGMEFGMGALQPRLPEDIWRSGYGDCKDKSNLAVLCLREVGIQASLALVETAHAGLVDKRFPDYRPFDHAIVAAEIDGEKIFCDPTIRYGTPGLLGASTSDRDVLLVKHNGVEWARTPPFAGGENAYRIDAAMDPHGAIEGWLEMTCTGYYQAYYRAYIETLAPEELRREVQETLSGIIAGARLVDTVRGKPEEGTIWRCFFSLPSHTEEDAGTRELQFPAGQAVTLATDESEQRETARFLWQITWRVNAKIKVPAGWEVAERPSAFDLEAGPYLVRAAWTPTPGLLTAAYEARLTKSLLPPAEHPIVWRGARAISNWLRKPLRLTSATTSPPPGPEAPSLSNFPLMPTGRGQLRLVEERYPEEGDLQLRRAALNKVIEYFPDDPETLFSARAHLALISWYQKKPEEARQTLQTLTTNPSPKVGEETLWWARYMSALILSDAGKHQESLPEFEAIRARASLSPFRRSWACFQAAYGLKQLGRRDEALTRAREGLDMHEIDSGGELLFLAASLLFELDRPSELKAIIQSAVEAQGSRSVGAMTRLLRLAHSWANDGHPTWAKELVEMVREKVREDWHGTEFASELEGVSATLLAAESFAAAQEDLKSFLAAHPELEALKAPLEGWPNTKQSAVAAYEKADKANDSHLAYRLALNLASAFPPSTDFAASIWKAAVHLDQHERNLQIRNPSDLLQTLINTAAKLPKSDDFYYEMKFLAGRVAEQRHNQWQQSAAIYSSLINDAAMPESFLVSAITRLADCQQELRQWDATAATLAKLQKLKTYSHAADGLARAAFLHLEMQQPAEALRLLRVIDNRDFALKHSAMSDTLEQLLDLAKDASLAKRHWSKIPEWWAAYIKLQSDLGIEDTTIVPIIVDEEAFGAAMAPALQQRDRAALAPFVRQLAHSARWLPKSAISFVWLCSTQLPNLYPEHRQSLLALVDSILTPLEPLTDNERRSRLMYLTASSIDSDKPQASVNHIREYFQAYPADDHAVTFAMARLWGLAAVNVPEERKGAVAALERALASQQLQGDRSGSALILADLYRIGGQPDKEKQVLLAAVGHPSVTSDPQQLETLKRRLDTLEGGTAFANAVKRWLATHTPPWFEYAKPKRLEDLGAEENLQQELEENEDNRLPPENMKAFFLAASSEHASAEHRLSWWESAFHLFVRLQISDFETRREALAAVLDDPEAPASMKDSAFRMAYVHASEWEAQDLLKYLRAQTSRPEITPFTHDRIRILQKAAELDLAKISDISSALEDQAKRRDDSGLNFLVHRIAQRAIRYGNEPALQAIADTLAQLRASGAADASSLQSLRLSILRDLTAMKQLLPAINAMAEVVLNHAGAAPASSVEFPQFLGGNVLPRLTAPQVMAWARQELRAGRRFASDLTLWHNYVEACSEASTKDTWELRKSLISSATAAAKSDEACVRIGGLAMHGTDLDSPVERAYLLEVLNPWRTRTDLPLTHTAMRLLDAKLAARLGEKIDFQALADLEGEEEAIAELRLTAAYQSGNKARINKFVDEVGVDHLLDAGNLIMVIPSLRLCDRQAELTLALEAAEEEIYRAVLTSWTGLSDHDVLLAGALAEAVGSARFLPEAWLAFVPKAYPEPTVNLPLAMRVALLNNDWQAAYDAATQGIRQFPTYYTTYWYQAKALWELGRKDEALEPLHTYLKYCHDEACYPQAVALQKLAEKHQ